MILLPMTLFKDMVTFVFLILILALFLSFFRLARGPSLPDRVVALNLISSIVIGMISAYAILTKEPVFLNVAVVVALVSFLGTVAFARFLEKGRA